MTPLLGVKSKNYFGTSLDILLKFSRPLPIIDLSSLRLCRSHLMASKAQLWEAGFREWLPLSIDVRTEQALIAGTHVAFASSLYLGDAALFESRPSGRQDHQSHRPLLPHLESSSSRATKSPCVRLP